MNRLSYLYTRAGGQHTRRHPSSLSNPAHKDTAYGDGNVANTHRHTALIFSAARSAWQTQQDAHALTKTSQCLRQLVNARGKAEVIITSVFNSSVTGGRSFSVSKEHVNKQDELFTGQRGRLACTGQPRALRSSRSGIISGRERNRKMSSVQVKTLKTEPTGNLHSK